MFNISLLGEGASKDQCSEVYSGEKPFSIPETRFLADWMLANNLYSCTSLHSYSQMVLLSYGCPAVATSYPEMEEDVIIKDPNETAIFSKYTFLKFVTCLFRQKLHNWQ